MNVFQAAMGKLPKNNKETVPSTETNSAEKSQDDSTGNKGENVDNIKPMETEDGKEKEKKTDEEKRAEITAAVENWRDTFVHEKSSYNAVKISKRFDKSKIPAWCLNKELQGKDDKKYHYPMMQMIAVFSYHLSQLNGGEKIVTSKGHNNFTYAESTKLWSPSEIENEFACNFVEGKDGTISVQIMLYVDYGESKSFGRVKNKIFKHLNSEKLFFYTYDGTGEYFNCTTVGFFVGLYPEAVNLEELRESVNMDILEQFVCHKENYENKIEQYNAPNLLPRVQVYRKQTETHLGRKGKSMFIDAICIDVPYNLRALYQKIISDWYDGSPGLEFCDRSLEHDWRTKSAYEALVTKHQNFLDSHEIVRLRSLEEEELEDIDKDLRAIDEVKKVYKASNFDRTGYCNVVVKKKCDNTYVEQIDEILRNMDKKINRKFNYLPNRVKNMSDQISEKNMERYNKEYANKPSAWNVSNKHVGNIGNDDKWGTASVTTDITTTIQVEEMEKNKGEIENLKRMVATLQQDQTKTAKVADTAMSKIDEVKLTADIARMTAVAAKEKAIEVEQQLQTVLTETNTKIATNIGETTSLKSTIDEMNKNFNAKFEAMMLMMTKQSATPVSHSTSTIALSNINNAQVSNVAHDSQPTFTNIPTENNQKASLPPVFNATHVSITTNNETTPTKNNAPTNIVTPTNADDLDKNITIDDPPNVKRKTLNN